MNKNLLILTTMILSYFVAPLSVKAIEPAKQSAESEQTKQTEQAKPSKVVVYKEIDGYTLSLHIFNPAGHKATDKTPAIVFFHGGGWRQGHPSHFFRQSQYLAKRGMVAISAQYRVNNINGTSPKESVMDAKSAMRWVREHAKTLGIDPNMIAAGGGSAGGHIAAATGTATSFEEKSDNKAISYRPDALVLFNPVFDNGPKGYGFERVKEYWQQISPLHNITKETPPTIGFFGELDTAIKLASVYQYEKAMAEAGVPFEMHIYKQQPHGFFNNAKYTETVLAMDNFLTENAFLKKKDK